jgi:GTPase
MITFGGVRVASTEIQKGEHLVPEVEEGNREYKFKLTDLTDDQLTHRITQLNWRLNEGNDEAFYLIGVEDNGNQLGLSDEDLQESLKNLQFIADQVGCEMMVQQLYAGEQGTTAEVYMRRRERLTVEVVQVNVAVAGDLNSGKSTMIGVLSTGQLDNGKGLARTKVLTHNHEVESGLTSCISHHSLHFSGDGEVRSHTIPLTHQLLNNTLFFLAFLQILNANPLPGTGKSKRIRALSDLELADETNRTVVLMDLAGHAKYLKTTLHGLVGRRPDHCIVCVSATTGLNSITTEHLGVCMYLNVPLIIVITKADCISFSNGGAAKGKAQAKKRNNSYGESTTATESAAPLNSDSASALNRLVESIQQVLAGPQRTAATISTDAELVQLLQRSADADLSAAEKAVVPIFTVSNVTGEGLPLLRSYLFQLPTHAKSRLALQMQATCVRILGSIGNTEDREDVIFPRDEELYSVKKEVRHSTNRYAVGSAREDNQAEDADTSIGAGMRCHSSSEDNLTSHSSTAAFKASTPPQAAAIKRPNSSPDLPATAGKSSASAMNREFAQFVEFSAPSLVDTVQQERRPAIPPAASRTKVLIGSVDSGKIAVGEPMLFGPTSTGEFISVSLFCTSFCTFCNPSLYHDLNSPNLSQVIVSSLRLSNVPVRCASAGQTVTFKLAECVTPAPTARAALDASNGACTGRCRTSATGLVLLSPPDLGAAPALAHWEFEAEVLVLNHPSKIRVNYEPVVHIDCVKQSAKLVSITKIPPAGDSKQQATTAGAVGCDEVGNGERALCR